MSRTGAAHVPIPLITSMFRGWPGGAVRHHSQLRGTQPAVVSSRTGVPPRRGRPPERPHDSVVHPTQPPPEADAVEANRIDTPAAEGCHMTPGGPGGERRAHERRGTRRHPRPRSAERGATKR